jgi:hypothetical protein
VHKALLINSSYALRTQEWFNLPKLRPWLVLVGVVEVSQVGGTRGAATVFLAVNIVNQLHRRIWPHHHIRQRQACCPSGPGVQPGSREEFFSASDPEAFSPPIAAPADLRLRSAPWRNLWWYDGGSKHLWNVGECLPNDTANIPEDSHPHTRLCENQISRQDNRSPNSESNQYEAGC